MKIDTLDKKIITELEKDARCTSSKLSERLAISEGAIRSRIRKLLRRNVISITAIPNLNIFGMNFVAIVGIRVFLPYLQAVALQLREQKNICYLANVTGDYDLIAIVATKEAKDFSDFLERINSDIHQIERTESYVCLNTYKGSISKLETIQLLG